MPKSASRRLLIDEKTSSYDTPTIFYASDISAINGNIKMNKYMPRRELRGYCRASVAIDLTAKALLPCKYRQRRNIARVGGSFAATKRNHQTHRAAALEGYEPSSATTATFRWFHFQSIYYAKDAGLRQYGRRKCDILRVPHRRYDIWR